MRGFTIAIVAAAMAAPLALPLAAAAQPKGCTAKDPALCDATKRETLADKQFGPRQDGMASYVRKSVRDDDKDNRQSVEVQINEAIMAGRCDDAVKIAKDNGYHAAVSSIRRSCKS
ncbi:hypothetical protein LRS10_03350 [Phenylobacterium sp. J426]|uniref:hypothetical protein n=1 Tax=Phenylobacterium sp. J426 TaxID=2898439 RepID=UPI0021511CBA|nr:hypothetical protein [Phenylobacterium sp. J426]MCR5873310.1 hypothetical protein [Phenylobacterium sp. J426]